MPTRYPSGDASLLGMDKATNRTKLGGRITDVEQWDSHGIELSSRSPPTTTLMSAVATSPLFTARSRLLSVAYIYML